MKLKEIAEILKLDKTAGNLEKEFEGISYDTRTLERGNIFFALQGSRSSGNSFVEVAVEKGASAIVSEELIPDLDVPVLAVEDIREGMGHVAHHYFDFPSLSMICTGITGTNGKTTTSYLVDAIMKRKYGKTSVFGTLGMSWNDSVLDIGLTTPESPTIASELARLSDSGCRAVTMEVSSHGLSLGRVAGMEFDVAIFTNLSQDHLDFHGDMDSYFEAKMLLFKGLGTGIKRGKGIVNIDDPAGRRVLEIAPAERLTYSMSEQNADVRATHYELHPWGSVIEVQSDLGKTEIRLQLPGRFNIANALAGFSTGLALNANKEEIVEGLESVKSVRGRMEVVEGDGVRVVIDYAHTPQALENLLSTLGEIFTGRLITVIGCGGDRDRDKRPLMGEVAARLSDFLIITSDNPRREDPEKILDALETGVRDVGKDYTRLTDREEAIQEAIGMASEGDIVVIAGKGHEDYQIIGTERRHFDDRKVACQILGYEDMDDGKLEVK
jgi:UDP-N-acetylmuramoyl-L-alanyl-D-glutamate--2,6-diaminopimelate ligase